MNKNIPEYCRESFSLQENYRKFVNSIGCIRKNKHYNPNPAAVLYPHEYEACLNDELCRALLTGHPVFVYNPNTFEYELKHERFPD